MKHVLPKNSSSDLLQVSNLNHIRMETHPSKLKVFEPRRDSHISVKTEILVKITDKFCTKIHEVYNNRNFLPFSLYETTIVRYAE